MGKVPIVVAEFGAFLVHIAGSGRRQSKLFARIVSMLLSAIVLSGCATVPALRPIALGEVVSISVVANQKYLGSINIHNTAIKDGAVVGGGSGGLAGGMWGLSCGPWAPLCVPLGAIGGMLVGGAAGVGVGLTGVLPPEKVEQVKQRLVRLEQGHSLLVGLRRNLEDRAQKYWTLTSETSTPLVTVEVQEIEVDATRDEQLRFVLRIQVSQRETAASREVGRNQKTYEYATPFGTMVAWLDETSDFLDTSFTSASQQIAAQVISDLVAK